MIFNKKTFWIDEKPPTWPLQMRSFGIRDHRTEQMGKKNYFLIIWTLSGSGYIVKDNIKQTINSEDLLIIPKDTPCEYGNLSKNSSWETCWITIIGLELESIMKSLNLNKFKLFHKAIIPQIHFSKLLHTINFPILYGEIERAQITLKLIYELSAFIKKKEIKAPELRFTKLIEWLILNLDKNINVESMAEKVSMSRSHFSREFTKSMGITPIKYLLETRLNKAKELLSSTSLNIKEVAIKSGFFDTAHFCRIFKIYSSMSPTEFRNTALI